MAALGCGRAQEGDAERAVMVVGIGSRPLETVCCVAT